MELKPVTEMTYKEAVEQLEKILAAMQSESCDIDKLASYTRRATELITECRARLTRTDAEIQSILSNLDAGNGQA